MVGRSELLDNRPLCKCHIIEVKRVEKLNVMEAMEQSIRDSEWMQDGVPALFHRRNRKPWLVTMRLVDWLKLYRSRDEVENEHRANAEKSATEARMKQGQIGFHGTI